MNWIELDNNSMRGDTIIAISNEGLLRLKNGNIRVAGYRDCVRINGHKTRIYRVIAQYFLPKTEEYIKLGRDCIDHITHTPVEMNINDVRNLRWCTYKENNNFEEAKANQYKAQRNRNEDWCRRISEGKKGKSTWNKGLHGDEYLSHYKLGRTYNSSLDSPLGG